jgi:hypothetical protein
VIVVDAIGWLAAAALLLAYALVTTSRIQPTGLGYLLLNIAGSAGLALNAAAHSALPSMALNVLWLGFGLHAVRPAKRQAASSAPESH